MDIESIGQVYGATVKTVYGPYTRKDLRQHVSILFEDGSRRTVSYPKLLMELHIKRRLSDNETVDHIDRNFHNNRIDNLQILDRATHSSKDAIKVSKIEIICSWCGDKALKKARYLHHNAKLGKAGPFCSRKCAGRYSAELQNNRIVNLPAQSQMPVSSRDYFLEEK